MVRCPSSRGPAPPWRWTGAAIRTPRIAMSTRVSMLIALPCVVLPGPGSEHVGGVDDRALALVVDEGVLHVQRVGRDDPFDEVLLARAVQRQAEPAAVDLAALVDERLQRAVDVLLARERRRPGGGKAPGGQAVQRARAVEVDRRLETLPQGPGGLQDGHEAHRGLVRDAVHQREVDLAVLGLVVGEHLGSAVDARPLLQGRVRDLGDALLLGVGQVGRHGAVPSGWWLMNGSNGYP